MTATTDTTPRPGFAPALIAVAGFLALHPHLPTPRSIDVMYYAWDARHWVRVTLPQGDDPLDSEHAVTAWAGVLGNQGAEITQCTDNDGRPWTHIDTKGDAVGLHFDVVICHRYPEPTTREGS
jgi:hypothetical protein